MTRHVPPQRWADAWAGKLTDAERAELDAHAERCPACTRARERVTRASDSFASIKQLQTPELGWDSVRAKVHWSVSTERHAKQAPPQRAGWIAAGIVAAAGIAAVTLVDTPDAPESPIQPIAIPTPVHPPSRAVAALAALINRATGDVMVDGIRPADPFALRLAAGTVIATGDGRVDVQFGAASAFGLGPHSRLELVRFDSRAIELSIDGVIDVEVAPRHHDQTFVVRAGSRSIEVRGTQFRVRHATGQTTVACRHGLVAVHDGVARIDVAAQRRVELGARDSHVVSMTTEEVAELAEATPLTMPVWDLGALASSAPLDIATAGRRAIRVDGVEVGEAPMRIRVMPGRHTVEATDNQGRYQRAGWVDVAAPAAHGKPARLEILPEPPSTRGIDARRRQLRAGIDRGKLAGCTRAAAKQGLLDGAYVQIEINVDAAGSVGFLNVLETDLPHKLADCIHDVLTNIRFPTGQAASWRERIDL